jgi:murein DD-endopeptidase MepM/ murein hydrolase activator NlpD
MNRAIHYLLFVVAALFMVSGCGGGDGSQQLSMAKDVDSDQKLGWPLDCTIDDACSHYIGYPDIDGDWYAFNCGWAGYYLHTGTDITNVDWTPGTAVLAAADGEVLWVLDGKYDGCEMEISTHPDCQPPTQSVGPGVSSGYMSCTEGRPEYCDPGSEYESCYWCSYGGNEIVIKHSNVPGVLATRYDHLRTNSITVQPGEHVTKGQKIAEMGSAGKSLGPHLHFEVHATSYGIPVDPWYGECSLNTSESLWEAWIQEAASQGNVEPEPNWTCNAEVCTINDWP